MLRERFSNFPKRTIILALVFVVIMANVVDAYKIEAWELFYTENDFLRNVYSFFPVLSLTINTLTVSNQFISDTWYSTEGQSTVYDRNYYEHLDQTDCANITDDMSTSSEGSISVWVNLDDINDAYHSIVETVDSPLNNQNLWNFRIMDGNGGGSYDGDVQIIKMGNGNICINAYGNTRLYNNRWYHLVLRQNSSGISLFIDGVPQTMTYFTGNDSAQCWWDSLQAGTRWHHGCWYWNAQPPNGHFQGQMDDLIIWERPITYQEILHINSSGRDNATIDTNNLIAYYRFTNNLNDSTGNFNMEWNNGISFTEENTLTTDVLDFIALNNIDADTLTANDIDVIRAVVTNMTVDRWLHPTPSPTAFMIEAYDGGGWRTRGNIFPFENKTDDIGQPNNFYRYGYYDNIIYGTEGYELDPIDCFEHIQFKPTSISRNGWREVEPSSYPCYETHCWNETEWINTTCEETIPMGETMKFPCQKPIIVEKCKPLLNMNKCQQYTMACIRKIFEILREAKL